MVNIQKTEKPCKWGNKMKSRRRVWMQFHKLQKNNKHILLKDKKLMEIEYVLKRMAEKNKHL